MKNLVKVITIGIFILFAFSLISKSENIKVDLAQKIAIKVAYAHFVNHEAENYQVQRLHLYPNLSSPTIFIVDMKPGGFVLVSNEKNTYPVLGFSENGHFEINEMPPALEELIIGYSDQITFIKDNNLQATDKIRSKWEYYSTDQGDNSATVRSAIDPLITTTWNQTRYYNEYCPVDSNVVQQMNYHVPAGCFAVAMAQVIRYYEHPTYGEGQHSYMLPDYGEMSANFESPGYDYINMPNALDDYNDEVARLIYHCGVSLTTAYAPTASLAFVSDVRAAMMDHFRYQDELQQVYRSQYNDEEWTNLITNELNQNRPVIYRGTGTTGGHGWVCDGYNTEELFHMNWGWSGAFDGYYELSDLHPAGYFFNDAQMALIQMIPLPTGTVEIEENSFIIYPNPASDVIRIRFNRKMQDRKMQDARCKSISLFAIEGKKILEREFMDNELEFNVSSLPNGMYIIRLQSEDEFFLAS